ncbi:MAG: Toxin HigB-1 [Chlamydiales bacterium]|nr:Toxin HigB-1 [Chlamydiales bacterium]
MIKSFGNKCAEDLYDGINSKAARQLPRHLHTLAREKLDILDAAQELNDLRVPPGNRLEKLKGDLKSKHSIRINNQWRIVFLWRDGHSQEVEIIDYH